MQEFNKILGAVFGGGGTTGAIPGVLGSPGIAGITGIMGLISKMSLAAKEKQALDRSLWYSKHPEAIAAMESKFEKPLDQGLVKGTENVVNASLAEQGLSQAPGIQSQVLAQALAPYKQNTQQMALMETFKALGLPAEALSALSMVQSPDQLALLLKNILPQSKPTPMPTTTGTMSDTGLTPPIFDTSGQGATANG